LEQPHQSGCAGSYLSSYCLLSALRLSSNPIQYFIKPIKKTQHATYYRLQLPDNGAKMLVHKYVQCISYTHLNVNPGFVIERVVTLYVPRTGNLPKSVAYRK
jgi:hypothetical protein